MNYNQVTIEDCIEMQEKKGMFVILKDGQVVGFRREKA